MNDNILTPNRYKFILISAFRITGIFRLLMLSCNHHRVRLRILLRLRSRIVFAVPASRSVLFGGSPRWGIWLSWLDCQLIKMKLDRMGRVAGETGICVSAGTRQLGEQ